MKTILAVAALVAASTAAEAPSRVLRPRATQICGQWDSVQTGNYIVYQDLWGMSSGTGSQCTTVNSVTNNVLSWSTSWSWSGGSSSVKSFANAITKFTVAQLSAISSIPSTWSWSYTGNSIVADVAYDMFTSSSATGSNEYEIMIWLTALGGAGPISATGSPIATPTITGVSWKLYSGMNGAMHVFSFVATTEQRNFSGDLKAFFSYLISSQGLPSSQYLLSIGAGTEPFTGSNAVLTVSAYSCSVSMSGGGGGNSGSSTTSSPTHTITTPPSSGETQSHYGQCGGSGWTGPTACVSPHTCSSANPWYSQCV